MKKGISFILIVFFLLSFFTKIVFASGSCSPDGYTILTINGIFTNLDGAILNKDKLTRKFDRIYNNQPLKVDYLYNPTHLSGVGDVIDAIQQGVFDQKSDYDLVEMINDASEKVTTQKLLLVGHSQGNFYANNFYEKVASQSGGVPEESIGVYGVGSPADYVAGDGKYLTSDTDEVIALLVGKYIEILPPNVHIPLEGGDGNGHAFSEVYLRHEGERIISDIKSSLDKLKENDEQELQESCIDAPELSFIHKIEGVMLASADFIIDTTKQATVYLAGKIYEVGLAMSNVLKNLLASAIESSTEEENNLITEPEPETKILEENNLENNGNNENEENTETEISEKNISAEIISVQSEEPNVTENISQPVTSVIFLHQKKDVISEENDDEEEEEEIIDPVVEEPIIEDPIVEDPITEDPVVVDPVIVPDTTAPVINILGDEIKIVEKNSKYEDEGISVIDNVDDVLEIITTTTGVDLVDTSTIGGRYIITYTATDLSNNVATATRTVIVDDGAMLYRPQSVFVSGDYVYVVSENNALEIIDASDLSTLVHSGFILNEMGDTALFSPKSVVVKDNYAYVVSYSNALEIIDISNPVLPVHKGILRNGENGAALNRPIAIALNENYAYIVSYGGQNIEIVDISDPENPTHISSYYTGQTSVPLSIFVSGNYAYITFSIYGSSDGFLQVVDISNPTLLSLEGAIYHTVDDASLSNPSSVFVFGNYAYVASRGDKTLEIIDVSNPSAPKHKAKLSTDFGNLENFTPNSIFVSDDYAYITSYVGDTLEIVDISDPANPVHVGSLANGVGGAALSNPTSVFVLGDYAFVSSYTSNALEVIDISDPAHPVHKNKISKGETENSDPEPEIEEETDTDAPTILSAEVITTTTIEITFSEDIDGSTLNTSGNEFTVSGHTVSEANESADGVITLTLSTEIKTGEIINVTFTSDNFKDLAGNQAISPATVVATNNLVSVVSLEPSIMTASFVEEFTEETEVETETETEIVEEEIINDVEENVEEIEETIQGTETEEEIIENVESIEILPNVAI